jgi:hypothetical protein
MERELWFETDQLRKLRRKHRSLLRAIPDDDLRRGSVTVEEPTGSLPEQDHPFIELALRQLAEQLLDRDKAAREYLKQCEDTLPDRLLRDHLAKLSSLELTGVVLDMTDPAEPPQPEAKFFSTVAASAVLTVVADRVAPDGYTDSRFARQHDGAS